MDVSGKIPFSKDYRILPKTGLTLLGEIGFGSKANSEWRLEMGYQINRIYQRINISMWFDKTVTSWHGFHFGLNRSFSLKITDRAQWSMYTGISVNKVFLCYTKREGRIYDSNGGLWDNYSYHYKEEEKYEPFCFGLQAGVEYVLKIKETKNLVFQNSYHIQTSRSPYFLLDDNYLLYGVLSVGYRFY